MLNKYLDNTATVEVAGTGLADHRGGKPQKTIQSPNRQCKAPTDYTKPRQSTQSPKKIIQRHTKVSKDVTY